MERVVYHNPISQEKWDLFFGSISAEILPGAEWEQVFDSPLSLQEPTPNKPQNEQWQCVWDVLSIKVQESDVRRVAETMFDIKTTLLTPLNKRKRSEDSSSGGWGARGARGANTGNGSIIKPPSIFPVGTSETYASGTWVSMCLIYFVSSKSFVYTLHRV